MRPIARLSFLALLSPAVWAAAPADFLDAYSQEARRANPGFAPAATRGQQFFADRRGQEWSCASCHSANPAVPGRHAVTGKAIAPLAPAANPERFTREAKVEKWFRRNCNDVLGRACSAAEKADVLAYLMSLK